MNQPAKPPFKVALLWRGDRQVRVDARPETSRLRAIFAALTRRGVQVEPAVYSEDLANEVRNQLLQIDGVLVWVDPISEGRRRDSLDELLRNVSAAGVFVSAHPDVIGRMGVKAVLHRTRALGWGSDTHFYETPESFAAEFPQRLAQSGPRVLKQNRGNGGIGVWRVTFQPDGAVELLSARGEEPPRIMSLADFLSEPRDDFGSGGGLVDQPFQARHMEGMVRCYMSGGRVAGFGHQLVRALADSELMPPAIPRNSRPGFRTDPAHHSD
ncbi:MAG: Cj0069 family protein [Novosphingobium sp.]|nr:Cj0069 family protein [Novosphingobium sp.]